MADGLERITNLVAMLLETKAPLTFEQIAHELVGQYPANPVAARGAFERDKAMLREIGVPLDSVVLGGTDAGRTAYRIDRRRYELADLELAPDERAALEMAAATVRLGDARFGLLKLGGTGAQGEADLSPVVANVPDLVDLPLLREATTEHREVRFGYHGSERHLHPYALLLRDGFWYVIGDDVDQDQVRTYRVDRIEAGESGGVSSGPPGAFERPVGFDPRAVFPSDPKLFGPPSATRAMVLVDEPLVRAVLHDVGEEAVVERRPDGSVVIAVPCNTPQFFASWLLGWGESVEVLSPPAVRDVVIGRLRAKAGRS